MYEIGKTYKTPKGEILVLDRTKKQYLSDGTVRHPRATIKFLKTGTVINVQTCNIKTGKFEDYREPTVYGVGYLGSPIRIPERNSNSSIRRVYDLWANMLKRCYGGYPSSYVGCTVDKRWHNFTTFLNTIIDVDGYEFWEKNPYMHLDKDIKGNGKVYSKDTCMFVTATENIQDCLNRRWHKK